MFDWMRVLDAHYCSMTAADEEEIVRRVAAGGDVASLAIRTCACGVTVDGFYEYMDHLKGVLGNAGWVVDAKASR